MREYKLSDGLGEKSVKVKNDDDCVFCDHCSGVFWDYSNGIYLVLCDKHDALIHHGCPDFKEDHKSE